MCSSDLFETPSEKMAREAAEAAKSAAMSGLNQLPEGSAFIGQKAPVRTNARKVRPAQTQVQPSQDATEKILGIKRPVSGEQKLSYSSSATQGQGGAGSGAQPPVGSAFGGGTAQGQSQQQANQPGADPYAGMNRQQRRAAERRAAKRRRKN